MSVKRQFTGHRSGSSREPQTGEQRLTNDVCKRPRATLPLNVRNGWKADVDVGVRQPHGSQMRWIALSSLFLCVACGVASQPESARTVAAFEVPLPTPQERTEFLALLSAAAQAEGLHVDASSAEDLERMSGDSPMTIHAGVWRGANDEEAVASVMDLPGNLGRAWLSFSQGEDPPLVDRFRTRAMQRIMERWPSTQSLPIMPTGAIPLPADLRQTRQGYRVRAEAASRYELPPESPLIDRD
jgi:hypothetical protein